jgi:hypothetical protein
VACDCSFWTIELVVKGNLQVALLLESPGAVQCQGYWRRFRVQGSCSLMVRITTPVQLPVPNSTSLAFGVTELAKTMLAALLALLATTIDHYPIVAKHLTLQCRILGRSIVGSISTKRQQTGRYLALPNGSRLSKLHMLASILWLPCRVISWTLDILRFQLGIVPTNSTLITAIQLSIPYVSRTGARS